MPPTQQGQVYKLGKGRYGLRWYDVDGVRRRKSSFPTQSAARAHYREQIEPVLRGEPVPAPAMTLSEFVPGYLQRHAANVRAPTIQTLTERLRYATRAYGTFPYVTLSG